MSVFKNLTRSDLWLDAPDGQKIKIGSEAQFEGSNYYKRYTSEVLPADEAFLAILVDDGAPWSSSDVPNLLKAWEISVEPGDTFADHVYPFSEDDYLGANAEFVQIMVDDQPVEVRINNNPDSIFRMDADSEQVFNREELVVSKIEFRAHSTTASTANIRLMAAASTDN